MGCILVRLGVFSLLIVLSACSGRAKIAPGELPAPPQKVSQAKVEKTFYAVKGSAMQEGSTLVQSGERWQKVKTIADKIAQAADLGPQYPYPVYVAENDDPKKINAYVADGSVIVVYSGLIDKVNTAQLAAIMGHEVSHMLGKHHEDNTAEQRKSTVSTVSSLLGTVAGVAAATLTGDSSLGRMAGRVTASTTQVVGTGAFVRSYDRDMEREADALGLVLMAKAGYDPRAAVVFWKNADEIFGHSSGIAFFSTHPSHDDRAEELTQQLEVAMRIYNTRQNALAKK